MALRGSSFSDIGHFSSLTPSIEISKKINDKLISIKSKFSTYSDDKTIGDEFVVNKFSATSGEEKFSADYSRAISRDGDIIKSEYTCGDDTTSELEFSNFIPKNLPAVTNDSIKPLRDSLFLILKNVQWLQANRVINLDAKNYGKKSRCCHPSGHDIANQIKGDHQENILSKANDWLSKQETLPDKISIKKISGKRELFLTKNNADTNLEFSSEGVRSLLPIILSICWAEENINSSPSMLTIEEPESHLHPNVQINLFNRIIESINGGIPIILETHSIYILRALQLAVLEKRISPDKVSLNWIDQQQNSATINRIIIDDDAKLLGWRPDAYEQEQDLSRKIISARLLG